MQKLKVSLKKAIFIYLLTALFLCFEMGLQVSPSVMTQQLMKSLDITTVGLGFMSGFYFYTYTAMQVPAGMLFDRFKVRWVIVVPLLICASGAFVFSTADGIVMGSLGRMLMGIGSAFAFVSVLVVASHLFDSKYFGILAGVTLMLAAVGAMLGEAPLVPVVDYLGWRDTMRVLGGIAVLLAILIWVFVRYEHCDNFRSKQVQHPEKRVTIWQSLRLIMAKPQTWFVAIYACCSWAPMAAFASLWGVPYFETVYGLSKLEASGVISLMWVGLALGSLLVGWVSDTFKMRRLPLVVVASTGFISLYLMNLHLAMPHWLLGTLVFLAGAASSGQALTFAVVKDNTDDIYSGAAMGFNNMAVVVAGAIFQPVVAMAISDQSIPHFVHGVDILVGCYAVAAVMGLFFIRSRRYR